MSENIIQPILFKSQKSGESAPAEMHAIDFTPQEQKARGLKTLALFWAIAIVCVLIPIAHFFLVPGFLIGGIVAAKRRWERAREGIEANGSCPVCKHTIHIDLEKNGEIPQWRDCPECGEALELQAAADKD